MEGVHPVHKLKAIQKMVGSCHCHRMFSAHLLLKPRLYVSWCHFIVLKSEGGKKSVSQILIWRKLWFEVSEANLIYIYCTSRPEDSAMIFLMLLFVLTLSFYYIYLFGENVVFLSFKT